MDSIAGLREWISSSDNIVFFGGAGVSTESGIPDFRSTDGLYREKWQYPPETILSHSFFVSHTEEFFSFYREKMLYLSAKPNAAHRALVKLERMGKCRAVITQNIDGLHQKAGSQRVLELHGSVHRNFCQSCGQCFTASQVAGIESVPRCVCGGLIKPDVVLYEEPLDQRVIRETISLISQADILIVGGTSLAVYPAAGLIDYYHGNKLVLINLSETPQDAKADLVIRGKIGEVMCQTVDAEENPEK